MIKKNRLQFIIFAIRWVYCLKILGLLILLAALTLSIFLYPRTVHAEAMLYINGGWGDFEIKTKDDQIQSVSENTRRHTGFGMDLNKEGYPLRVSFQWSFFETEEETEKWTTGALHENGLDINGGTFDVQAFVTLYTYSAVKDRIRVKPFIGGGLGYKRFKFERKGLNENMLSDPNAIEYFLGNQAITTIGATPHIGFFLEIPKLELECTVNLGWTFHAAKSNVDYHVFSKSGEVIHPVTIYTSGSSLVTGIQLIKSWESFSLALGYIWEKTQINDKSGYFNSNVDGASEDYPFPEFEIVQTFGQISLKYLF